MTTTQLLSSSHYALPNSSDSSCEDRFSILDSDDIQVPSWSLISALLSEPTGNSASLIDKLETIALCISGAKCPDYGLLKQMLDTRPHFFSKAWPSVVKVALQLPQHFPSGYVPILTATNNCLTFSRSQVACLVVHQFLCTLKSPPWQEGFQSFHIWYSLEQPHLSAAKAYLTALLSYLERLEKYTDEMQAEVSSPLGYPSDGPESWMVKYELHEAQPPHGDMPLQPIHILCLPEPSTSPQVLGLPRGASVISANKYIGFGRTGTQEETHVGASPEACPVVLFSPPLQDNQVIIVTGAEAMITIDGYGRDARCKEVLEVSPDRSAHRAKWSQRTMLFMDALELDLVSSKGLPDLVLGNVERERTKAYMAFSSRPELPYEEIFTGFWGCRTFGGNPYVKTTCQWIAASMAGVRLSFVCSGLNQEAFAKDLDIFVSKVMRLNITANKLESCLLAVDSGVGKDNEIFESILSKVEG